MVAAQVARLLAVLNGICHTPGTQLAAAECILGVQWLGAKWPWRDLLELGLEFEWLGPLG